MLTRPLAALLLFLLAGAADAQPKREPLVDRVKKSIDNGVRYLRNSQRPDGGWNVAVLDVKFKGGGTALAVLALLNSGVPVDDPVIKKGLTNLRGLDPDSTYVRALQTMALVEAGRAEDAEAIQRNVAWLIEARVLDDKGLRGWSYGKGPTNITDNSNSQYALLGLWAGRQAGVKLKREIWEQIRDFYRRTQLDEGAWTYSPVGGRGRDVGSLTMTTAGVCGLLIAALELNAGREKIDAEGRATNCGVYDDNDAVAKGLNWISGPQRDRLEYEVVQRTYYNLYGIERVGRLSGQRFLGDHDWYREGSQLLVNLQRPEGMWMGTNQQDWDKWPVISTSFALLFLSKGRTPVLISKLVHSDRVPRPLDDTDWNNDRNDLANLVEFSRKNLFKKLPLAWQTFDMMRSAVPRGGGGVNLTDEDLAEVTSDMLQSPIVYFNGHKSPRFRFTAVEKELIKRYVENGGFLFVEACCGSPDFDAGFKQLAAELWPDGTLDYLDGAHPIWSSFFLVKPGDPYKLMGISLGCKTILAYSPQDLSCQWESNNKTGRGEQAFKLGANVVAYATGMEPPRPKLTHVEVASGKADPLKIPRGFFKVAQLKHGGDWQPAPKAMHNLMDHLRKHAGLDVALKTDTQSIASNKSVIDYKFLYMHGRAEFSFTADQLKYLRFNLESGGLLFADACCGKPAFDKSFRQFSKVLFPDRKLEEVPLTDPLFGKDLNGIRLDESTIRCRREPAGPMRPVPPALEGIKIDGRWVLLYSKYDIGCALERHRSSDCLGYDPESAFRIAGAAVLYLLDMQL